MASACHLKNSLLNSNCVSFTYRRNEHARRVGSRWERERGWAMRKTRNFFFKHSGLPVNDSLHTNNTKITYMQGTHRREMLVISVSFMYHTSLANGSFLMSSSVLLWYLLISFRATVPGRYRWRFLAGDALCDHNEELGMVSRWNILPLIHPNNLNEVRKPPLPFFKFTSQHAELLFPW